MSITIEMPEKEVAALKRLTRLDNDAAAIVQAAREFLRLSQLREGNGKQAAHTAANILAGIAALPTTGGDPRTSQDHDRVLYGEQDVR